MRLLLGFVACLLAFYDLLGYTTSLEQVDGDAAVKASVHLPIEHLLDNVVHYIMKKVVPWKAEKEVLGTVSSLLG
jgi:hypothetical protein